MSSPFARFNQPLANSPQMARLQQMYQTIFNSKNPQQAMQNMMASNPKFAQINTLLRQGRNPEQLFREMAKQRGIDPDAFIRQLQGNNGEQP